MFETEEQKQQRRRKELLDEIKSYLKVLGSAVLLFAIVGIPAYFAGKSIKDNPTFVSGETVVLNNSVSVKHNFIDPSHCALKEGSLVKIQHLFLREDIVLQEQVEWAWVNSEANCEGWVNVTNLKKIENCSFLCN